MANKRKSNKGSKGQKARNSQRRMRFPAPQKSLLDGHALAYRQLLLDPCASDLAHPVYADGSGGILSRFTSTASFGIGVADTGFIWHWTPGAMSLDTHELVITGSVNPGTIVTAFSTPSAPGKGYLPNNCMGYRCVAACATITYTGSELNRSGSLWFGQTLGELVNVGVGYSVDLLQPSLPHNIRTPDIPVDVLWRPGSNDNVWQQPYNNSIPGDKADKGAITVCATGLPVGVGVQIRMTAVYEYQPRYTSGITVTPSARNKTSNSLTQVLNSIPDHAWSRLGGLAAALGSSAIRSVGKYAQSTAFSLAAKAAPLLLTM